MKLKQGANFYVFRVGLSALQGGFPKLLARILGEGYIPTLLKMTTTETAEIAALRLHEKDTGSADVQVATLTQRITALTEHLKGNAKDHSSRRGLLKMVATRRRLLDYLKDNASERYQAVIEKLNLRK